MRFTHAPAHSRRAGATSVIAIVSSTRSDGLTRTAPRFTHSPGNLPLTRMKPGSKTSPGELFPFP